jgi:hypothetical protein
MTGDSFHPSEILTDIPDAAESPYKVCASVTSIILGSAAGEGPGHDITLLPSTAWSSAASGRAADETIGIRVNGLPNGLASPGPILSLSASSPISPEWIISPNFLDVDQYDIAQHDRTLVFISEGAERYGPPHGMQPLRQAFGVLLRCL